MTSELIRIGLSVVDHVFLCDEPPGGEVVHATDYVTQGGGMAATAAVTESPPTTRSAPSSDGTLDAPRGLACQIFLPLKDTFTV